MPGYNHYSDCTCGWCVKVSGVTRSNDDESDWFDYAPPWPGREATRDSYTTPNARCPVCGGSVFFYRSPDNGRVFFDDLGPPWPKHPCTDNPKLPVARVHKFSELQRPSPWEKEGWQPVHVARIAKVGPWAELTLYRVGGKGHFVRLTPWVDGLAPGRAAHMKPLDNLGIGRISMLQAVKGQLQASENMLLHRVFSVTGAAVIQRALDGEARFALAAAQASYEPWQRTPTRRSSAPYEPFVDFAITRAWLEKAQALGSREAAVGLQKLPAKAPSSGFKS